MATSRIMIVTALAAVSLSFSAANYAHEYEIHAQPSCTTYTGPAYAADWAWVRREQPSVICQRSNGTKYARATAETFQPYHEHIVPALYIEDAPLRTSKQRGSLSRRVLSHPYRMLLSKPVSI